MWLDEWELIPGRQWQDALEAIIGTTRSVAVFVGKEAIGPWQNLEMRACLQQFVNRKLPVIPVLLPGASHQPELPLFLQGFTSVDLRPTAGPTAIDRLESGYTRHQRRR